MQNDRNDLISRQAAIDHWRIIIDATSMDNRYDMGFVDGLEFCISHLSTMPSVQPQRKTDEWCTDCQEYDSEKHCCPRFNRVIRQTLSEQMEWNNHTVACLLAEMFGDTCACNYNGIDEWLPEKCEVIDACPNPVGVACWEQFLKHRAERRTDGKNTR